MNNGAAAMSIGQFSLIYLLLIIVIVIMKKAKIDQTKLLIVASLRMSIQLILVGFILSYMFANKHIIYTIVFLICMIGFAIHRVLSAQRQLNKKFKLIIALSMTLSGLFVLFFFVGIVVRVSIMDPQYTIPLAGMIIGNAMTGINLGLNNFVNSLSKEKHKIEALITIGVKPEKILLPFVKQSIETALLPTLNSMVGMGIIFLPGMMTGQILSGTIPTTAIMYQIAIMIAICTSVCLTVFASLNLGYKTLYDKNQIIHL